MALRFPSAAHGATAVEFAMIAFPFMMLLGVILETGFVTLSQQSLDVALERAARQLRTGAFQNMADGSDPRTRLVSVLCGQTFALFACSDVRIELTSTRTTADTAEGGGSVSVPLPTDPFDKSTKAWNASFGTRFDCPQGADVVVLRVAVPVPRLLWFLDFTGRVMPDGRQLLISTRVFQSEDYDQTSCE